MCEPSRSPVLLGLLLALGTCAPLDLTGKLCSSVRPCPTGWECFSDSCRLPGSGNRVLNGDFEKAVAGWIASHGTIAAVAPGRTSASAARWDTDGTAISVMTLVTPPVEAATDGTWCAEAWVQTGNGEEVAIQLLRLGDAVTENVGAAAPGLWIKLEASTLSLTSRPLSIALTSSMDAGVRQLRVDDVALWRSTNDGCVHP